MINRVEFLIVKIMNNVKKEQKQEELQTYGSWKEKKLKDCSLKVTFSTFLDPEGSY